MLSNCAETQFQSAKTAFERGRKALAPSAKTPAMHGFNPLPPSTAGERARFRTAVMLWACFNPLPPSNAGERPLVVSPFQVSPFQSAPAVAGGRKAKRSGTPFHPRVQGFNPAPAFERGRKYCFGCRTGIMMGFNPLPPSNAGESSFRCGLRILWTSFNPLPAFERGEKVDTEQRASLSQNSAKFSIRSRLRTREKVHVRSPQAHCPRVFESAPAFERGRKRLRGNGGAIRISVSIRSRASRTREKGVRDCWRSPENVDF